MISNEKRQALASQIQKGDLTAAVQIYEKIANRSIHRTMLEKFIKNIHPFNHTDPKSHDPIQMYKSILQAISERRKREREATQQAEQLIQTILHDTKPQPIAL